MDITLLKQKVTEWNKALDFFAKPEIKKSLANEEKKAIEFLTEYWRNNEFNPSICEKHINTLKDCDKLHSSNREIIEKSKTFRGIAQTFYTKNAEDFDQFRKELGWKPTPKHTPTPTPIPNHQHNEALMMLNVEKWSKAIQFLRSEEITPLLEANEMTAIELLNEMWRKPAYKPEMKEYSDELVKVLVDSHKLHSSNREIIEHSKNLCGVARKVYSNKETFDSFKKTITQYYKDHEPIKRVPKETPKKKETPDPTPIRRDNELILKDVLFGNTDANGTIIHDFGKKLYNTSKYISPRLIIASEYYGKENIEVQFKYPNGESASYDDDIDFKGKGEYNIAGWGNNTGTLYEDYSYIDITIICRGKKLWQGRLNLIQDSSKAQVPNIVDIKFGATDYDGNIVVVHGNPIPTGIPYLSPMIVVDNNFKGSIKFDIQYIYETRGTNQTSSEITINGPGEYCLSGWGRSDGDFYTTPETITCKISYKGKVLYTKKVKIGKGSSKKKTSSTHSYNNNGNLWQRFKNKIEDIGYWFDDQLDDPESVTGVISLILLILFAIIVVLTWIGEGFLSALIAAVVGFIVIGLLGSVLSFVVKIILYILRFIFYNVWTFLIAAILFLSQIIAPALFITLSDLFPFGDTTEQVEIMNFDSTPYYCTAQNGVNVRNRPSSSADKVGALLYNQQIEVYEIDGDFARINFNGNDAWVSKKYIAVDNDAFLARNAQQKGIKTLDNGLQYAIIKKGRGDKPKATDEVEVNLQTSLVDGTIINSSEEYGMPYTYKVNDCIACISSSLQDMKTGEKRRIYTPPHLAYGNSAVGTIPANSILIIDIELVSIVEKTSETSSSFIDFSVKQDDGTTVSLSDYVGHGRYVLVDFWASWCGPCMKSMPHLINFYRGQSRALDMLGIAVWDKPEESRKVIDRYQVPYPQILNADNSHTNLYDIESIPHLILFDPEGNIVLRGYPDDDFFAQVKSIIYQ